MKNLQAKSYTLEYIFKLWLKNKTDLKIQSYQKYENLINNFLVNSLGNIKINKLTNIDIINFFNSLKSSISTKKTLLYIIRATLEYARKNNFCNYIDLKEIKFKNIKKSNYVLSKNDQIKLENILKSNKNIRKICLLLCLYTGLRIGEICGLKWGNINFDKKYLEVKRTIERIKNTDNRISTKTILIASTPKSETSNRIVPIPDFLIEFLEEFKGSDDYFILSNSKKLYDPRLLEACYKRILTNNNINYTNFHTLRHTFATRCIESKMDIKTLSEILGHSSVEITLKLYVHPSYELKKNSIENLVQFMSLNS